MRGGDVGMIEIIVEKHDNGQLVPVKELVRCKDCKHWPNNGMEVPEHLPYMLPCKHNQTNPNWFCAYGELKE